ncbi:MAG: hypothetical protein D6696_01385 [Acidobacteria bacterium]|nr:MAG: hypothetical protein D6696_01385 [Acidobacteriota bacterium]
MNHHAATSTGAERYVVLDAARFVALAGMVLVNFKIVMGAEGAGAGAADAPRLRSTAGAAGVV